MISIIIPVYNSEKYLFICLNSILKQTYSDFEVICIDNCSIDSSVEILEYFSKDGRITILKNTENKGQSYSRNKGLKYAKGDYVFFLDSDDWISPHTLEELYTNAKSNDSDLVFYKLTRFNNNNFILNKPAFDLSTYFDKNTDYTNFTFTYKDIKYAVLNTSFAPYLKLYKKSFLDQYDDLIFPEGLVYEDILFHVKTILRASKISFVPKFLYVYKTDNENSIMHNDSKIFDIFRIIDMVENFLLTNNFFNEFKLEFYAFKIVQILQYLNMSHNENYFKISKEKFEELNLIFTEDIKKQLKNNVYNWNDYLKVLNSNSIQEYLGNDDEEFILSKEIYKELACDDTQTRHEIWYLKNMLSGEKNNILKFDEIGNAKNKFNNSQVNAVLEQFKTETIKISNILCYREKLNKKVLDNIQEGNFYANNDSSLPSSIIGFKIYDSDKIILHEGHHRIAHMILNGETEVKMKVFYAPEFLFKKWQNRDI